VLADGLPVNLKLQSRKSCVITYVFTTLLIHLHARSCKDFSDLQGVRVGTLISTLTYVFLGIATIQQYLYTPSQLSTVFLEILISEDLDCRFLFSLQGDRRICRHSKLLIDAGPGFVRRGQATVFAEQAGASRARWRLNSWSELCV